MDKTTVLIVEDEAIVAADLTNKLKLLGYEVIGQTARGGEAIDLACRLQPDVVLMDIWLNGQMDGIEAAGAIRSRVDVPVVYLTAHSDVATLDRAKLSGPFGYVLKPFMEKELATAIEMALYLHQVNQQLRRSRDELEQRVEERTRELRQANEAISKLNADLEQRVSERTAQLEAANDELEAFTYSVSHDLRAPLRGITGFSKLLHEDCGDCLSAEGKKCLERIVTATGRMDRLIDDLLEFSRMQRAEMRRGRVDLSGNARRIAGSLKEAQPERQVEFIIADDLVAEGDEQLLAVVLENLLNNAWKFTGKVPRATIEMGTAPHNGKPAFFVRDNGAGFDMTYAEKLFKPFQRLHSIDQFPGTGIGLATVRRIIHRHGGQVWAEGEEGRGATVWFTLG